MAKGENKKKRRGSRKANRFGVVMTDRLRLFLIACFILGFLAVAFIAWWTG